ncbi:MAG: T9SS type A sorting domain-containing protein [Bacteroidetes bacterium]|nr:T9SS type A sorting domain-containing protein [Bacteroidota bacterium]
MKKYYYFSLFFCFSFNLTWAQQIAVDKDSLKIFGRGDTLYVYNIDDSTLTINSLYSVNPIYGYWLTISTKDSSFPYYFAHNYKRPLELKLRNNEAIKFIFERVDLCTACKRSSTNEYFRDTVKLISNSKQNDTLLLFVEGDGILSSINNENNLSFEYILYQNYPNPFNPSTTIKYIISKYSHVSLKVYDLLGREVQTLVSEEKPAGKYQTIFNATNLSSGVYIYVLRTEGYSASRKLILLK